MSTSGTSESFSRERFSRERFKRRREGGRELRHKAPPCEPAGAGRTPARDGPGARDLRRGGRRAGRGAGGARRSWARIARTRAVSLSNPVANRESRIGLRDGPRARRRRSARQVAGLQAAAAAVLVAGVWVREVSVRGSVSVLVRPWVRQERGEEGTFRESRREGGRKRAALAVCDSVLTGACRTRRRRRRRRRSRRRRGGSRGGRGRFMLTNLR
jgi:hypothetical protein